MMTFENIRNSAVERKLKSLEIIKVIPFIAHSTSSTVGGDNLYRSLIQQKTYGRTYIKPQSIIAGFGAVKTQSYQKREFNVTKRQ
jgi:hypothetical protein